VTVPVGTPTPGATAVIVTVNVTDCPGVLGLTDETRADEVLALLTVRFALPLLLACVALPPYEALTGSTPTVVDVKLTEHVDVSVVAPSGARVQVVELNTSLPAPDVKLTVPDGFDFVPLSVSTTVAVT